MTLIDLREVHDEALLRCVHDGLYLRNFPLPEEREDLQDWQRLLWEPEQDSDAPLLHALVEGNRLDTPDATIDGFVFFELYRQSRCGLVSYLAVDPGARRRGCGRGLVSHAIETLKADARATGGPLHAVFAEIHDPGSDMYTDVMNPAERVSFFARLGARRVPIPYVQPDLGHGYGPARLWLIALPLDGPLSDLSTNDVLAFVNELYRAGRRGLSPDLQRMESALKTRIVRLSPLRPVLARGAFAFRKYGVALHFVTHGPPSALLPASAQFGSFERDVLAFAYRETPPFSSTAIHVPDQYRQVRLRFSPELDFVSEGRVCTLVDEDQRPPRELQLRASVTRFTSGVNVFHLALTPRPGSDAVALTEYDLIRLAKLWEGGEQIVGPFEGQGAERCIRFHLRGEDDGVGPTELARAVLGEAAAASPPRAGTIELITTSTEEVVRWGEVWEVVRRLKADVRASGAPTFPDAELRRVVEGISGIVQGLVDFEQMDEQELEEVFAGTDVNERGLQGVHKGTLVLMTDADRVLDVGLRSFGVSPYLLLPHALLLHNEAILREAAVEVPEEKADRELGSARNHLPRHERSRRRFEQRKQALRAALDREYLPDVFHYPNERRIYEQGHSSRGLWAQQQDLRMRLAETEAQYEIATETRRRMADDARNALLLVLSFASYRAAFPGAPDWALALGLAAIAFTYVLVRR